MEYTPDSVSLSGNISDHHGGDLKPEIYFNAIQDFHNLDHIHISAQTMPCFDVAPLNKYPNSNCLMNLDYLEHKSFTGNCSGEHDMVMDNFLSSLMSERTVPQSTTLFNYQFEMKTANFVVSNQITCSNADNGYNYQANCSKSLDSSSVSLSTRRSEKCRKKSRVVKGQWSIEEDRYANYTYRNQTDPQNGEGSQLLVQSNW